MSLNCLCGMQDMKNVEEKSTLSNLLPDCKHTFFYQIIPTLIIPNGKICIML